MILSDARVVGMHKVGLHGNDSLFHCISDTFFNAIYIVSLLLQSLIQLSQKTFRSVVTCQEVLVRRLVVVRVFVQREVGQVHEHVFHVACIWLPVGLCT